MLSTGTVLSTGLPHVTMAHAKVVGHVTFCPLEKLGLVASDAA